MNTETNEQEFCGLCEGPVTDPENNEFYRQYDICSYECWMKYYDLPKDFDLSLFGGICVDCSQWSDNSGESYYGGPHYCMDEFNGGVSRKPCEMRQRELDLQIQVKTLKNTIIAAVIWLKNDKTDVALNCLEGVLK